MAKQWTPEEDRYLFDHYEERSLEEWAKRYGTTKKAISNKMSKLRKQFSQEPEEERMEEVLEEVSEEEEKALPKQWTAEEEDLLFRNYKTHSIDEWAERFGVSKKAIINKMSSLRKRLSTPEEKPAEPPKIQKPPEKPKKYKLVPSPYEIKTADGWQRIMMRVVDETG